MPRLIITGDDEAAWNAARKLGISASSIPKAMTPRGREQFVWEYLHPDTEPHRLQAYMEYGKKREAEFLGAWVEKHYGIIHNTSLYGHADNERHLATPDGIAPNGFDLAEIKTTTQPLPNPPRKYRDQMQWQMHVMEAERVLFVYEQHRDFTPLDMPYAQWYHRDDTRIAELVAVANALLFEIDAARAEGEVDG